MLTLGFADVDMTTAIQTLGPSITHPMVPNLSLLNETFASSEPFNGAPDFYVCYVKACMLPIRKVQHDLFNLYFQFVHPMFPVVDEYYFNKLHRRYLGHEELLPPVDFMIYQAILAAGFGVSITHARVDGCRTNTL